MPDLIDTAEMYLRTIYELEEDGVTPLRARIAERLGQSGPTVSETVGRMQRDGLLTLSDNRHIELTDSGRRAAIRVMRKHRLAERLLADVIGLEWEYVHDEACRWEHVMSDRVERKLVALLAETGVSPYGNPIPGLDELGVPGSDQITTAEASAARGGGSEVTLAQALAQGLNEVRVIRLGEHVQVDRTVLARFTSGGLLPGAAIRARTDGGNVVLVRVGPEPADEVTVPVHIADHIFIGSVT